MFAGQAFARRASLVFIGTCLVVAWASGARAYEPPSTPTYVISRQIEVAAVGVNLASGLADLEALSPRVATECPHALVGAPTGTQRQELETEMAFDVALTLTHPLQEPVDGFAEATRQYLHWRPKRLNELMHAYLRELTSYFAIEVPNLCPDLTAWVTSGFKTVSPSTTRFMAQLQRFRRSESATRASQVRQTLYPKETREEKALLIRVEGVETGQARLVDSRLEAAQSKVARLLGAAGVGHVSLVVPRVQSR